MDYKISPEQYTMVARALEQAYNFCLYTDQARCAMQGGPVENSNLTEILMLTKADFRDINEDLYEEAVQDIE